MRLDKFLSHASHLSRAQSRRAIKARRVLVNGEIITKSDHAIDETDQVELAGNELALPSSHYIMLYKPAGYVCATTDSDHPTVIDLLSADFSDLSIAGRLDIDSTGLVLLSNDGPWLHRISSPRHQHKKKYLASVADTITLDTVRQFEAGSMLRNETKPTLPAKLEKITERTAEVTLYEGRYHQIKRMFAACGNKVVDLHRYQVAHIQLDPDLKPGDYRALTAAELQSLNA